MAWKAVLSDIHANWPALEAVLRDLERLQRTYPTDEIWFCGDLVGYGADTLDVVHWAREHMDRWVLGNHDFEVGIFLRVFEQKGTISLPHKPPSGISRRAWYSWDEALKQLFKDSSACMWFKAFSEQDRAPLLFQEDRWTIVMTHGALLYLPGEESGAERALYNALTSYIFPWEDEKKYRILLRPLLESGVLSSSALERRSILIFYGHTHIPTVQMIAQDEKGNWVFREHLTQYGQPIEIPSSSVILINPGSVGQPRDGDVRSSYALLHPEENLVMVRRVPYDVKEAVRRVYWISQVGEELARYLMEAPIPQVDQIPAAYRALIGRRMQSSSPVEENENGELD